MDGIAVRVGGGVRSVSRAAIDDRAGATARRTGLGWDRYDSMIAAVLVLATFVVHPFGLLIHRPYWLDEAWIAALTRVPFRRALALSSSTPTGWLTLVWLVPGTLLQRGRLVSLFFSMLATGAAYVLARGLAWDRRGTARLAAIAVAVVVSCIPIALVRNDLKQYTCDAFLALSLLAVTGLVGRAANARAVVWLGVAALVAAPFSTTSAFVSVACFTGALAAALIARHYEHAVATLVVGGVAALGLGVFFAVTVFPRVTAGLTLYWSPYFLTGGSIDMLDQSWNRLGDLSTSLAMPASLFIALFGLGIVALVRLRAPAVAIAVPFLWVEMLIAARFRKYPFLDQRTFHFVLIPTVAVLAIGVVWTVLRLATRLALVGGLVALLAAALFVHGVVPEWHRFGVPHEDVRTQVVYVAHHMRPNDVVIVNSSATYGFAYYWRGDSVSAAAKKGAIGFVMEVANPNVIFARERGPHAVFATLRGAIALQRQLGPGSRIFIVLSHVLPPEQTAWSHAFTALRLHPHAVGRGPERVRVVESSLRPGAPAAPTIGSAVAGDAEATVSWTPPLDNGTSPITGYVVTPYVGLSPQPSVVFHSTATIQVITGLSNGTTYRFKVAAFNSTGTGATSTVTNPIQPRPDT